MAVALHNAAPLKPEIRLGQALSEYEAILTDDQKIEFWGYRGQQPPDANDVMRLTAKIDGENSDRRSRRCVGPRLTNVLQSVQQFSTVIDIIIGGSQSLLASAIWGAVKMTLQVTSAFSSYFESLSTLFMNIGRSCPRYQDFGLLYPKSTGLQNSLCEYFTTIVKLCRHAVLFIRKPFLFQLSSSVLIPFQSEFGHFEVDLGRLASTICEEASLASKQEQSMEVTRSSAFRETVLKFSAKASQGLQEARKLRSWKAQAQFLDACSTYDHHTAWKQARKAGTTTWIYDTDEYKRWTKETTSSILWCTGILGSGKTVVSANVVENLATTVPAAVVAYFFCKHDEVESLKSRAIIGNIARQLLSHVKPEIFDTVDLRDMSFLSTLKVLGHLQNLLPLEQSAYFLVIDGLDECNEIELKLLVQQLSALLASKHTLHIYCSSRPDVYQQVSAHLQPRYTISMSEAHSEISQYIKSELEERLELGSLCLGDPTLILTIHDALVKGSQGMFLWVVFQLDSICSEATDEDIANSLQSLPKDLPETFNRVLRKLERTKAVNPGLCQKIFELMAAAQRPLTLEELREAISVVPGETMWNAKRLVNDMHKTLNSCGSLLVLDEENSTAHFAHHSVKQHLLSEFMDPSVKKYQVHQSVADENLGEICVTYLNLDVFNTQLTKVETTRKSPVNDIPSAVLSQSLSRSGVVSSLALRLLKSRETIKHDVLSQLRNEVGHASGSSKQVHRVYSFLPYAQKHWHFHSKRLKSRRHSSYRLFSRLVSGGVNMVRLPWTGIKGTVMDTSEGAGLHWAARNGHEAVVRLLLARDDVEVNSKERGGQTPLAWAAGPGHEAVVKLLLARDDIKINSKDKYNQTPLSRAVKNGHETVVRLLLARDDVEINLKNKRGETPLSWAAGQGHEAVFRLLLVRNDVEVNSKDEEGRTPLFWAAAQGHETVIRLLLTRDDVEVNSKDKGGRTPLSWAAGQGHEAVVRLLLARDDVEVNSKERGGQTPLSSAAEGGHEAVVRLLLLLAAREGFEIDSKDEEGRTPLFYAAAQGHETVVRLFLARDDVEVNTKDKVNRTPLSWAAERGHETVVELFLARDDVEVNLKDKYNRTPVSRAVKEGHEAVVRLLQSKNAL